MQKYGLVLAGGGAKGAYQLGAWKAMIELGISFTAVAGVSIGSINGALIAAGDYENAMRLWQSVSVDKGVNISEELKDPENLFSFRNFGALFKEIIRNGGIDASPTREFLKEFIDEEKVRKSEIKFGLVTFLLSEFTPLEIFADKIPEGQLVDYLLASSKVPGVSKIGPEGERYLDGGVYDNAPIGLLRKNGYNKIVVVDISTRKGIGHKEDLSCAQVVMIRPYDIEDLGASFDFSEEMYEKRIKMGYLDTRKTFGYLSGRRFYFEKDAFDEMIDEFGADACEQLESFASEIGLEKIKIYSEFGFLSELKKKYEEYKAEAISEEKEQRFYSQILKKITMYKDNDDYAQAIKILESIEA